MKDYLKKNLHKKKCIGGNPNGDSKTLGDEEEERT